MNTHVSAEGIEFTYGACGCEGCDECRPLFDMNNNEIAEN